MFSELTSTTALLEGLPKPAPISLMNTTGSLVSGAPLNYQPQPLKLSLQIPVAGALRLSPHLRSTDVEDTGLVPRLVLVTFQLL